MTALHSPWSHMEASESFVCLVLEVWYIYYHCLIKTKTTSPISFSLETWF